MTRCRLSGVSWCFVCPLTFSPMSYMSTHPADDVRALCRTYQAHALEMSCRMGGWPGLVV
jgi:hypothetical protein